MKNRTEELANSLTHGIGILFALFATTYLLLHSMALGDSYYTGSVITFGGTMILLYTMSTIYHALQDEKRKQIFRKFDHSAIFLFIAGSYTPFTLVTLRESGVWGWWLFCIVWGAAAAGILISLIRVKGGWIKTVCYLLMGWVVVFAFNPLNEALGSRPEALYWLAAGGICYTLGTIFYSLSRRIPYMHAIWHLFVLGGSACHFMAVRAIA